ncbi:MAG TPA: glycosyltransferase [Candidatus Baltobacteraceae bacterium]
MSERFHRDLRAYCFRVPSVHRAQLFSLKLEHVEIANFRRRYVDAVLVDGSAIFPVGFIFIDSGGNAILHEQHSAMHESVRRWLARTVTQWVGGKSQDANLEADVFSTDENLRSEILSAADVADRPFPGLSPYASLFTEAERYASVTPFVFGRTAIDFNPGFGYGARLLADVAASVSLPERALTRIMKRLRPKLKAAQGGAEVAVWLDVSDTDLSSALDEMNASLLPGGVAIVSRVGADAADELRAAGADVIKMSRPGCDGLGALDEYLGVFRAQIAARPFAVPQAQNGSDASIAVSPRPLRVLFALRPTAQSIFGGDVVQVRETAGALRRRGHFVEISMMPSLDASGFDIVHLTNITVPPETLPQAQSLAAFDGAVVMMPIFTDHCDEAAWGMNVSTSVFAVSQGPDDLREKLERIEARTISVGRYTPPPARAEMIEGYTDMQKATLEYVDFFIANAHSEMNRLYRYLSCDIPYAIAPSCANPRTYGTHARDRFVHRFGLQDFVLLAGRYESRKNQLAFFEATRELSLPLLFIGNNYDPTFGKILRLHRPARAAYIAHLPEEDLAGAFAAARVVAIPSWDEVVSLTALNAAISEASMVLTRNSYEHEYFTDDAEYCDPGSTRSIAHAVRRAWDTHEERAPRRTALAERVRRNYSWDRSAELTEAAYYRVLAFNPRRERRLARRGAAVLAQ